MVKNLSDGNLGRSSIFGILGKIPKFKPDRKLVILGILASMASGGLLLSRLANNQVLQAEKAKQQQEVIPEIKTVTALGRLEPQGEVIKLSAPASSPGQGNRLEKLLVEEGEAVRAGQVVAVLDNSDKLQAAYERSKQGVEVARVNLEKVRSGAKVGEIAAQRAEIARIQAQSLGEERTQKETLGRLEAQWEGEKASQKASMGKLEAELANARSEFNRYDRLYREGAISQSNFDSKRLSVDTLVQQLSEAKANFERIDRTGNQQIREAKAVLNRIQSVSNQQVSSARGTLDKITEVRPVDVAAATAELKQAIASQKEAKANLEQAFVKTPSDGVVFKIHTRPGESISNDGIIELGKVQQMVVTAEVYQTSISKIKIGQKVRVMSNSLPGELQGTVSAIGWQIQRQNVINADPSDNIDSRVVEVKVNLDGVSSRKAARFTNLQVKAIFEI